MENKKVLILDYTIDKSEGETIAQHLPKNVIYDIYYINKKDSFPRKFKHIYSHVIHSGSTLSVNKIEAFTHRTIKSIQECVDYNIAQMGICYGHQFISRSLCGIEAVRTSPKGLEVGWKPVYFDLKNTPINNIQSEETLWQFHFDEVVKIPEGSQIFAKSNHTEIQGYIHYKKKILSVQFHPEFLKESGDTFFTKNKYPIEKSGHDLSQVLDGKPSPNMGPLFFTEFLRFFG